MGYLATQGPFLVIEGDDQQLTIRREAVVMVQERDGLIELWAEIAPGTYAGAKLVTRETNVTALDVAFLLSDDPMSEMIECPITAAWPVALPSL